MSTLVIFMVKVAIYLLAFYLIYSLLLSRDTSYTRNRSYILMSLVLSFCLPLITFSTSRPMGIQFFGKFLAEVLVTAPANSAVKVDKGFFSAISLQNLNTIYFIMVALFLIKLLVDLVNLAYLILKRKTKGNRIIYFNGFKTAGFSSMGYIFINSRLTTEEAEEIIKHEQNHLKKVHFLDVLIVEGITAFQWFNPAIYLFNRSLRAIHEYQADEGCLRSGIPVVNYQCLLLNQVFKSNVFNLSNSFSNPSLVKKRMIMMTKKRTSSLAALKMLLVIPVAVTVLLSVSSLTTAPSDSSVNRITDYQEKQVRSLTEKQLNPYVSVEQMPLFVGGDAGLLKFIAENTHYPESAKLKNIQGRVIVRFCVTADGGVTLTSILKGVDPALDTEAIRVVNSLPSFEPGKDRGKAVPVWYMVPITFTLR